MTFNTYHSHVLKKVNNIKKDSVRKNKLEDQSEMNHQQYVRFSISYDPSVTGISNGGAQVELKDKKSFSTDGEKGYFDKFVDENRKNRKRVFLNTFEFVGKNKISVLKFFPTRKRVKKTDFISYSPYKQGFNFIISKRALLLFKNFNLPPINLIDVEIEEWTDKYYLIGFSMIPDTEIDLEKSTFYNSKEEKEFKYLTYEEYRKTDFNVMPLELYLKGKYPFDILFIQGHRFFVSEQLVNTLLINKDIMGFDIIEYPTVIN